MNSEPFSETTQKRNDLLFANRKSFGRKPEGCGDRAPSELQDEARGLAAFVWRALRNLADVLPGW